MLKAVIFDIDGVLLDSKEANYVYLRDICKLLGFKAPSKKAFDKSFYFLPIRESIKKVSNLVDFAEIEKIVAPARKKVNSHFGLIKLFQDSTKVIKQLSKTFKLGVATSRSKPGLEHYFQFAKTRKFFKTAVGIHHVKNHKPHPEPLLLACKKLKVKPSEAVYIGDAPTDLLAARAAGLKIIIFGNEKVKGADAYVKNYNQLIPAINRLENA